MKLTVFKLYFTKQKHETIFNRSYQMFDVVNFKEALIVELIKHDVH